MPEVAGPAAAVDPAQEFWAFSLEFYGHPTVSTACLNCQDRAGLDVNLILLCCWYGWSGRGALSQRDLARAEAAIIEWRRAVLLPLRAVRITLKKWPGEGADSLRGVVKEAELAAERVEQTMLVAALRPASADKPIPPSSARLADVRTSLTAYFTERNAEIGLIAPLLQVLDATNDSPSAL